MAESMLKLRRLPLALAFLLFGFAGVPVAGASADHRPAAIASSDPSALVPAEQAKANEPAEPGSADPSDSGDAALPSAGESLVALRRHFSSRQLAGLCSSPLGAGYRARAPPSP